MKSDEAWRRLTGWGVIQCTEDTHTHMYTRHKCARTEICSYRIYAHPQIAHVVYMPTRRETESKIVTIFPIHTCKWWFTTERLTKATGRSGEERVAKQRGTKKKEYLNRKAKAARKQTPFKREIDCERLLPQWESRSCVHSGNRDSELQSVAVTPTLWDTSKQESVSGSRAGAACM